MTQVQTQNDEWKRFVLSIFGLVMKILSDSFCPVIMRPKDWSREGNWREYLVGLSKFWFLTFSWDEIWIQPIYYRPTVGRQPIFQSKLIIKCKWPYVNILPTTWIMYKETHNISNLTSTAYRKTSTSFYRPSSIWILKLWTKLIEWNLPEIRTKENNRNPLIVSHWESQFEISHKMNQYFKTPCKITP